MNFNKEITIQGKVIAKQSPVFVIAEAGVNHGGDMVVAKQLIDLACEAGADAVKFQTFRAEHLILKNVQKAPYQKLTTGVCESQMDMLKRLEVTKDQNKKLRDYCNERDIIFLSTPFDEVSLEELDELDMPAYKIASTDLTNLPFLSKIAQKGKPIFLSSGMSYLSEVQMALETIYNYNRDVVLLQCTANYPIKDSEANLKVLETFRRKFDILLGYSDHTVSIGAAPFAVPMGAKVIEKHFTLDKAAEGPDHSASLSPDEFKKFVALIRKVEIFMGCDIKKPTLSEVETRASLQKCLVARRKICKGEAFTVENISAKRTGGKGLSPIYFREIEGLISSEDFDVDEIIRS